MSKTVSNSLQELKPLLPRGYQKKITAKLKEVSLSQVKKAFAGEAVGEKIMRKIFRAASRVSKEHLDGEILVKEQTKALKRLAAKAE